MIARRWACMQAAHRWNAPNTSTHAATRGEIKQLLAGQTSVILEAVDERLDEKFGQVTTQVDAVMKEIQAHRDEDKIGARQLRRHEDRLQSHEVRITALEARP